MTRPEPRIFIAGATGYTGQAVVAQLCQGREDGLVVVAHVRPDSSRLEHWRAHFEAQGAQVDTTPWEAAAMARTLKTWQPSAVFALLGTTAARQRKERSAGRDAAAASYEAVDYGLTLLLLEAAEACGSAPRFMYLSSAGVSASAIGGYLQVRWRLEQRLRASPLPWTIAHPAFITGPDRDEDRLGERVGALLSDGVLGALATLGLARPQARFGSMNSATLARGLIHHLFSPAGEGQVIEAQALRAVSDRDRRGMG